MSTKITARKLSNGGLFIFNSEKKDLFLISQENTKHWEASGKDSAAIEELVKSGKASHFDKNLLHQISDALTKIAFLG